MKKKEFILKVRNSGKLFGKDILKIGIDDEDEYGDVNCEILLSDYKRLNLKKKDKVKVIIEKIQ